MRLQVDKKPLKRRKLLVLSSHSFCCFFLPFCTRPPPSPLLVVVSRHIKFTFWCCFAYQPDPDDMKCPMFVSQLMLQTILYVHSFFSQHTQRTYWRSRLGILILGSAFLCILDSLTGNCGTMGGRRRMRTYSSGSENEWMKLKCCSCWTRSHWLFTFNHFSSSSSGRRAAWLCIFLISKWSSLLRCFVEDRRFEKWKAVKMNSTISHLQCFTLHQSHEKFLITFQVASKSDNKFSFLCGSSSTPTHSRLARVCW